MFVTVCWTHTRFMWFCLPNNRFSTLVIFIFKKEKKSKQDENNLKILKMELENVVKQFLRR